MLGAARLGSALSGIDTPTLLGVWATAPYLHDGAAATLDEVFRVPRGRRYDSDNGVASGGATRIGPENFVDLNNDDTVRSRTYVQVAGGGQRLTFSNVDGGPGGNGDIELRYSNSPFAPQVSVIVNGVPRNLPLPNANNDPTYRATNWHTARLHDVPLNAGASNTIALESTPWYVSTDEIVVSHSGHRTAAAAHRVALSASASDQAALQAYLLQLDRPAAPISNSLFSDGFENPP